MIPDNEYKLLTYSDAYYYVIDKHPEYSWINKLEFRRIIKLYFTYIVKMIVEGLVFRIPEDLGKIYIQPVKKRLAAKSGSTHINKQIDWAATRVKKKQLIEEFGEETLYNKVTNPQGRKWITFYSESESDLDPYYYKFFWKRYGQKVPGLYIYKFIPTKGPRGIRTILGNYIKKNPGVKDKYKRWGKNKKV